MSADYSNFKLNNYRSWVSSSHDEMECDAKVMDYLRKEHPLNNHASPPRIQELSQNFFAEPPIVPSTSSETSMEEDSDSLEGLEFSWKQDDSAAEVVDFKKDDFKRWLSQPQKDEFYPPKMNCVQGVAYYVCERVPEAELKQELMDLQNDVAPYSDEKQASLFYDFLPELLHLTPEYTIETTFEILKDNFKEGSIQPYSLIAFGEPTGSFHVVIVTKNIKLRSLWFNPGTYSETSFGKYEPDLVIDQVRQALESYVKYCPEDSRQLGLQTDKCYISTKFCKSAHT